VCLVSFCLQALSLNLFCLLNCGVFLGKKGQFVWTEGQDEEALSRGVYNAYTSHNLRYSQVCLEVLLKMQFSLSKP